MLPDQTPDKKLIRGIEHYPPKNLASILTTSGCPMMCTFCGRSFDRTFVDRSIASIREELEEIRSYPGSPPVYVMDDCFLSQTKRFNEIAACLKEMGGVFTAGSRIMAITPDKLQTFMASGGRKILVGVESGSQRILDRIKKKLKVAEIVRRCRWLNEAALPWSAFVMVGLPFETLEDLQMTEDLLYQIQPTFISINRFTPYPGTEIYREFYRNANLRFMDLFQMNCNSVTPSAPGVEERIDRMFEDFDRYNAQKKQALANKGGNNYL